MRRCDKLAAAAALLVLVLGSRPAARAGEVTVPVNIGVGPAAHFITGPVQDDQLLHGGLKLSIYAIIDQATLAANADRIPSGLRKTVLAMEELRFSPSILIPDTLFISPKIEDTQMWGISWAPFGLGLALLRRPVRLWIGAAVRLTYAFIESDTIGTTHFLRPGLDVGIDLEIPLSDSFLISLGWTSQFYVPQRVDGGVFDTGPFEDTIWHIGQGYLLLNFRFPYTTNL